MKKERGLSLVQIMIVVALVGLLLAVIIEEYAEPESDYVMTSVRG